jgi:hypothetical protein
MPVVFTHMLREDAVDISVFRMSTYICLVLVAARYLNLVSNRQVSSGRVIWVRHVADCWSGSRWMVSPDVVVAGGGEDVRERAERPAAAATPLCEEAVN